MARAHYIVRVGNEGFAARTSDRAPNHWHYLSPQYIWGFPKNMPHVKVRAQFEADVDNPRVTAYIWFLCNGHGGPGHFVTVGVGRRHLGHGPVINGQLPIPMEVVVRLQTGFDHWFDWRPVNPSAAFRNRVRRLEVPRPPYIPTLRHVSAEHPSYQIFEDLIDDVENHGTVATNVVAPSAPLDPPIEKDLENVRREQANPHAEGFVYLIRMSSHPFLKIGMSLDPDVRLRTLQTGNPYPLRLVRTWRVGDMRRVEMGLHRAFQGRRADNEGGTEWFDFGGGRDAQKVDVVDEEVVRDVETAIGSLDS
ncbi:uncharacterized protein KY384_000742 [Bacidia gigantensis]|uniref:uncharacterized protein n=1 Tax=Bacidia gigantensis TaxID=2732470 RepID=UPI001D03AF10|nr:uncharacterized protein KY384_000742 [Bacidia gigantensis]KAG8525980.1 hypothetical protein KY384_000742 [Bacidia gigantensis]